MEAQVLKLLDRIGMKILATLQKNARISLADLGRTVGLSSPAAAERIRKMETAGIITGYHARIDPQVLGPTVTAFIQLTTEAHHYPAVQRLAADLPEVVTCHHISGGASYILQVRVAAVADLEALVARFSPFGQTHTSIALSTPVDKSAFLPLPQ